MARGVKFNIFEKSIFCEFSDVTHAHIAVILNVFLAYKFCVCSLNFATQNGPGTAAGSQGVFRGKGVGSDMGARQLFGSWDTLSSCRDKRSSFLLVGNQNSRFVEIE
jgi:hypothetical protein